jgi:membrane-anchored glycerophosphoryl diester phosphodiesterase (GDPDase)
MMSDSVLLIVPAFLVALPIALYLYTIFTLTVPIRVVERLGIGESIRRSFELISGKWWFTFWLFFVLWMIIGILMMIFQIPMQVVMMSAFFGGETNSGGTAMVILGTIAGALAQLVYSLFALASTLQYFNLVEMKEGVGMQDRIREIGGGSSDARALG